MQARIEAASIYSLTFFEKPPRLVIRLFRGLKSKGVVFNKLCHLASHFKLISNFLPP